MAVRDLRVATVNGSLAGREIIIERIEPGDGRFIPNKTIKDRYRIEYNNGTLVEIKGIAGLRKGETVILPWDLLEELVGLKLKEETYLEMERIGGRNWLRMRWISMRHWR